MTDSELLEFWYAALRADIGVVIQTDELERLRVRLYSVRNSIADPQLDTLAIVSDPQDTAQLWIIKKDLNNVQSE